MFSTKGIQIFISILAARQYDESSNILFVTDNLNAIVITNGHGYFVNSSIHKERALRRWTITRKRVVVVTLIGLYFVGQGRVLWVTCRDPILVRIIFLESSPSIEEIKVPFLERGLESLSDYIGEELIGRLSTCNHTPQKYPMMIVVSVACRY